MSTSENHTEAPITSNDEHHDEAQMDGTTREPTVPVETEERPETPVGQTGGRVEHPSITQERQGFERVTYVEPKLMGMNVKPAPSDDPDTPGLTKAQKAAAVRKLMTVADQVELAGSLYFPANSHPRCVPSRTLWLPFLADDETANMMYDGKQAGLHLIWVTVFKTMNPGQPEVNLLKEGLKLAKDSGIIPDLELDDYSVLLAVRPSKAFVLAAKGDEAMKRIMHKKVWTVRTTAKSATFFLNHDVSWGSHVIYDVHNGGGDFIKDVLPKLYRTCGSAIQTKESADEKTVVFKDLAYHQVPHNPKTHKGAKGITWQIRWIPTIDACKPTWQAPRHLGKSNKGLVEVVKPALCSHCISWSHAQNQCAWWTDDLVVGGKGTPDAWQETKWIPILSARISKLTK